MICEPTNSRSTRVAVTTFWSGCGAAMRVILPAWTTSVTASPSPSGAADSCRTRTRPTPQATVASPRSRAVTVPSIRLFRPTNWATKRVRGLVNTASGVPICSIRPAFITDIDQTGDLGHLGGDGGAVVAAERQAELDVAPDTEVRKQRVVLPDETHPVTPRRPVEDVVAGDPDQTFIGRLEAGDDAQQRGLAAAARTDDGDELARLHPERRRREGDVVGEGLAHAFHREVRRATGRVRGGRGCHGAVTLGAKSSAPPGGSAPGRL